MSDVTATNESVFIKLELLEPDCAMVIELSLPQALDLAREIIRALEDADLRAAYNGSEQKEPAPW